MTNFKLKYKRYGERSILIEWPSEIDTEILQDILIFKETIERSIFKVIIEIKSAYNSILISYKNIITDYKEVVCLLKNLYNSKGGSLNRSAILWKIPVCYDDTFGLDLDIVSKTNQLEKEHIIKLHSEVMYTVYFIGFLPGFLYLGGLDDALDIPRKDTPRLQIEKGSVGIGSNQTGIYPDISPGGWNIIGNSPINFFNPKSDIPCFAKPGDRIKFYPISLKEHQNIKVSVSSGMYKMQNEAL